MGITLEVWRQAEHRSNRDSLCFCGTFVTLGSLRRERHLARAARACNISQPTLSGALVTLERELGVCLVVGGRRQFDLTPEGRRVLEGARSLLATEDTMRQGLKALRGGLTGLLRLGIIPAAMPVVGLLTEPFAQLTPP